MSSGKGIFLERLTEGCQKRRAALLQFLVQPYQRVFTNTLIVVSPGHEFFR